jgi:3-isopropylmalate/(R)-2-methylmalate dehydratase small subunit
MSAGVLRISGRAIPFGRDHVDTDLIIPAVHLKTTGRTGLGRFAFEAVRRKPGNVFDDPAFAGAPILIAGENFGCGSSREHAVWALADMGIEAVIALSFADIFAGNALRSGLVTVVLAPDQVEALLDIGGTATIEIDLEAMEVRAAGFSFPFALDPFRRDLLMRGADEIALTLESETAIAAYEAKAALLASPPPLT